MKLKQHITKLLLVLFLVPSFAMAQVDFNKRPDDDLGNVEDEFQEHFFEALKQKGIENYERAVEALSNGVKMIESRYTLSQKTALIKSTLVYQSRFVEFQ